MPHTHTQDPIDNGGAAAKARALPDIKQVAARRAMRSDFGPSLPAAPRSEFAAFDRPEAPDWLITEDYYEVDHGPIKSGKEATVNLVERRSPNGSCLLARKVYKSESERSFRRDQIYREGRKIRSSRTRRAIELGTQTGRNAMRSEWRHTEYLYLVKLWEAGVTVPYPVAFEGGLLMQYLGNEERSAPRLYEIKPTRDQAAALGDQILLEIRKMAGEGVVHGDLSAYNILVWEGAAWIIDLPQAVELGHNAHAPELLRRDIQNVARFLERRGLAVDLEEEFASCMSALYTTGP